MGEGRKIVSWPSRKNCVNPALAIFVVRQLAEKALEYNKPAFYCFIDIEKAFDKI